MILGAFFLCPALLNAQRDTTAALSPALSYQIQGEFDTLKLPDLQWILEEGGQALSHEQLQAGAFADAKLIDLSASPVFPIKAHRAYWFKIRLTAAEKPNAFGFVFYRNGDCWPFEPTFKQVQTFATGQDGKTLVGHSGSATPASKRDYPKHLIPSMTRGNIGVNERLDIWCKVSMAEPCNLQVDIELVREKIIVSPPFVSPKQVASNVLLGACVALLLIASLLLVWFKKPVYLWFFVFQLSALFNAFVAFYKNETYNLLFRENPRWFIFFILVGSTFQVTSLLQFGRVYVGTKQQFPRVHLLLGIAILSNFLVLLLGASARFILDNPNGIWFQLRGIVIVMIFITIILGVIPMMFSKNKLAQFFCIGAMLPISSMVYRLYLIIVLKTLHFKDIALFQSYGMILTMTLALAYRFKLEIADKESALKDKADAELKNAEQQLRMNMAAEEAQRLGELDRMKTNFFSNITHEFRTPLTLMIEPLRRILPKIKDPEVLENVQLAEKNSHQLLGLINQLLDMAKIESGQMTLDLRRGDLGQTVRNTFERFLPLAEKRGIKLRMAPLPSDLPPCDFDAGKVELVLNNLISNALKFTPEGGKVEVQCQIDPSSFIIQIKDSGIGIAPEHLDKIFDRFYQVDGSLTRSGEGTGIGLALSKELAALMGGQILVESQVGKGSVFTLRLASPLPPPKEGETAPPWPSPKGREAAPSLGQEEIKASTPPSSSPSRAAQSSTSPSFGGGRGEVPIVLVVEDNAELRNFIKKSIGEDWQVVEASDGEEGLKKALDLVPDLVVSDLMMPRKDGLTLLDDLKTNELTAHIPVVLLTAKSAIESKLKGLRHGADDYLTKPFSMDELLARMENLVENRRRLREIFGKQAIGFIAPPSGVSGGTSQAFLSEPDREFLQRFMLVLEKHLADETLGVEDFAQKMFISRVQLHRKLKALTDRPATDFIRDYRLECALNMLKNREGRVGDIALRVGFGNEKYFSTAFKEKFGVSPSQV